MSLIRRNTTRTIKGTTETTAQTDTPSVTTVAFNLQTTDRFYIGFRKPFASRYFALATPSSVVGAITLEYWNGTTWVAVKDLIDQTLGFTQSGFLSWDNATNNAWKASNQAPVSSDTEKLYWLRLSVGTNLSAGTTLQAVLNLFCDTELLSAYYPDLINDTRWLPPGQTDFLLQLVAAKDLIVQRLRQEGSILDESEILDVNQVAIPAVHALARIIMKPCASDDTDRQVAKDAMDEMNRELGRVRFTFDADNSGAISPAEQDAGNRVRIRG